MAIETERKYLCKMPDLSALRSLDGYRESDIEQVYLSVREGRTHRIRARKTEGVTVYTETIKEKISQMSCTEEERIISQTEYESLYQKRDPSLSVLEKKRITFTYRDQLFEVDIYPFYRRVCVVETELKNESECAVFPAALNVIKEVTGDFRFSNAALTREIPPETSFFG